jgi:hypothetical protein
LKSRRETERVRPDHGAFDFRVVAPHSPFRQLIEGFWG